MSPMAYLEALTNAPSLEELWDMHTQKMADYGFDRLMYGFTRYRTTTSFGDPEDFIILTNHSKDYTDGFIGQGMYAYAPMVRWVMDNQGACSWSIIRQMAEGGVLSASERRVYDFNRAKKLDAGFTISFKSVSPRTKGVISLAAREGISQSEVDAVLEEHGPDLVVMNNVAHLKIQTLPYSAPNRALTRRQREVLGWVGDGKTAQDIALLMGLTPATVEKHLRLARETLSVETTAQAVLKAGLQNQIFVVEA